jgi:hypothetical protein
MPTSYGAKAYLALAGELIRKVEYVWWKQNFK